MGSIDRTPAERRREGVRGCALPSGRFSVKIGGMSPPADPPIPPPSQRVRVRRVPDRGRYDKKVVHEILDAGFLCHLGFVHQDQPYVIPTLFGRQADTLYIHGSAASRALQTATALPVCVTVTHLDGLVLARSLFNHSANYRSVMVLGQATEVVDGTAKSAALQVISEHIIPGRWEEARQPNAKELRATTVLRLDLQESSAKIRTGPPVDEEEDLGLPIWAGVIPLTVHAGEPRRDRLVADDVPLPRSVVQWKLGGGRAI
jgi:uncharacterized protein